MSDFAEEVYGLLTDDWQSAREISERIQGYDTKTAIYKIRRVLSTYERYGLVEMAETERDGCHKRRYWRLSQ